jgi:citrate lyase subunit beta/citryl-CoA lyase
MYGRSIEELTKDVLNKLDIQNANITVNDFGALPFVLAARIEAAVKRCVPECEKEYLFKMSEHSKYGSERDRFRRSRLYLPGNEPKFMINAGIHKPDGIILDLEDSVAPAEKDAARYVVRNALRKINFFGAERMVRINQLPAGLDDLNYIVPHNVHLVLMPKCEHADQVKEVDNRIIEISQQIGRKEPVYIMPIIESALGAINAYEIASASDNLVALSIGLEDYTADIGTQRTLEGRESFWARSQVVNAARAAKVQPIDTVFSDVGDMEGLKESVIEAKGLGFEGKGCIHPRQIAVIHKAFAPAEKELDRAKKIVIAFEKAESEGKGVVSLGSKMIDPPVVKRALNTVRLATSLKILEENWREQDE